MKTLLHDAKVWEDGKFVPREWTLLTESGTEFPAAAPEGLGPVEAAGQYLLPALAELHADFRQPGLEHIYTFASGFEAMLRGGFSCALLTPEEHPVIDNPSVVELVRRQVENLPVDMRIAAAISSELKGELLPEMVEMVHAGAVAFSNGLKGLPTTRYLELALTYAKQCPCRVHLFPTERAWSSGVSVPAGHVADLYGLPGRPEFAETISVFRIIEVARAVGVPVHVKHVTLPSSVEMIAKAKTEGVDVTCDVPLMDLAFDEEDLVGLDASLHLVPPLRSAARRAKMVELVRAGAVDAVAAQHIPVLPERKTDHFSATEPGSVGLETAFPLLLEVLGGASEETLARAVELFSAGPRRVLGLGPADAAGEWMLWDPDATLIVSSSDFAGAVSNSPLMGQTLKGRCRALVLRGELLGA